MTAPFAAESGGSSAVTPSAVGRQRRACAQLVHGLHVPVACVMLGRKINNALLEPSSRRACVGVAVACCRVLAGTTRAAAGHVALTTGAGRERGRREGALHQVQDEHGA